MEEVYLFVLLLPHETVCMIHSKKLLCHYLVLRITARHLSSLVTNTMSVLKIIKWCN